MHDFHKEFEYAKAISKQAGIIVISNFRSENINYIFKEGDRESWLTKADNETENFIKRSLKDKYPDYGFIGEETQEELQDISWVVDPIDGTSPFARGIPEFGVVVGLKQGNKMIFVVIYFPATNELYSAYQNEGAFKNTKQIHVSSTVDIKRAIFSVSRTFAKIDEEFKPYLINLLTTYRVRLGMSSAVEDAYVASGVIDVSIRVNQAIWDAAPECLLMQEAGAIVTDLYGNSLHLIFTKESKTSYVATNPFLAEKYKDILYLKS